MSLLVWEWVPNISVGSLFFEKKININELSYNVIEIEKPNDEEPWFTYEILDDKTRFYVSNGVLNSVECLMNFTYKGCNLIGMKTNEVINLVDCKCYIADKWENGSEVSCDDLNVIFWEESGLISSVSVSGI